MAGSRLLRQIGGVDLLLGRGRRRRRPGRDARRRALVQYAILLS
jgi:hypothetical protein